MANQVNTYTQFLVLEGATNTSLILRNQHYFSVTFLGGNYLSGGTTLQKLFGGQTDVALIAGLRLPSDGLVLTGTEDPHIMLDKRTIKSGKITNIPLVLNMVAFIPAYMTSIGFSFKIAVTKTSDNFSATLDVLNDASNKSVLSSFLPSEVGKVLGVGKIVKDVFNKIDEARNKDLIQLAVNDFLVAASEGDAGPNMLQDGFLIIFVQDEQEEQKPWMSADGAIAELLFDKGGGQQERIDPSQATFVRPGDLQQPFMRAGGAAATGLQYDEKNKMLTLNGKLVTNTYVVLKIQRHLKQAENVNAAWSKKFQSAVSLLATPFVKTLAKLAELGPQVDDLIVAASTLLDEDPSLTRADKDLFVANYRQRIQTEMNQYKE